MRLCAVFSFSVSVQTRFCALGVAGVVLDLTRFIIEGV